MRLSSVLLSFLALHANGFLNVNRVDVNYNPAIVNLTVEYETDANGQSFINATFITFVEITKVKMYLKLNIAEDQNDKDYKKVIASSVFDLEKVFKGMQSNVFINTIFSAIRNSMAFEYKIPIAPVSV